MRYLAAAVITCATLAFLGHAVTRVTEYKQTLTKAKTVEYCVDRVVGAWRPEQ